MSRDGYLPDGVDYADIPGFADPDDPECACDHPQSAHEDGGFGECRAHDDGDDPDGLCPCQAFEPPDAY